MRKSSRVLLAVAAIAVLLVGLAGQVQAKVTRVDIESYEYTCFGSLENMWQEGDILHIRGFTHVNVDESVSPEFDGINTTVADAQINLRNGNTAIHGTMSFQPNTINGTWEGNWTFIANAGTVHGYAVAQGTGELSGKTLFLEVFDAPPSPESYEKCAAIGREYQDEGNTIAKGYILDTN